LKLKVLFYVFLFNNCNIVNTEDTYLDRVNFNINLPVDSNGFYYLYLDRSSFQTIHTFSGETIPSVYYKRFEWESNLNFSIGPYEASTANIRSYTNEYGEFRTSIGPILDMVGDTLLLTVRWDNRASLDDRYSFNPDSNRTFNIILK